MGCTSSKPSLSKDQKKEAAAYQARKKNGFKDPGLEQHRKNCVAQKKKLRHVEDPLTQKKKTAKVKQQKSRKKKKAPKISSPLLDSAAEGLILNENELQKQRKNLRSR